MHNIKARIEQQTILSASAQAHNDVQYKQIQSTEHTMKFEGKLTEEYIEKFPNQRYSNLVKFQNWKFRFRKIQNYTFFLSSEILRSTSATFE